MSPVCCALTRIRSQGYHINHRDVTDWVDILQEVMRLQNEQVHSVTRLSPQAHFQTHDT